MLTAFEKISRVHENETGTVVTCLHSYVGNPGSAPLEVLIL